MPNYKNSVETSAHKTNQKNADTTSFPTANQLRTQTIIGSPSRAAFYAEKVNDIRGSIQEIINDVAKKANDNKDAAEIVKNTNIDLLEHLKINSSMKSTSMENLVELDPESPYRQVGYHAINSPYKSPKQVNGLGSPYRSSGYESFNAKGESFNAKGSYKSPTNRKLDYQSQPSNPFVNGFSEEINNGQINEQIRLQNQNLKRMLNEEIRKNNQLLKRCKFLQMENAKLRSQFGSSNVHEGNSKNNQNQPQYYGSPSTNFNRSRLSNESDLLTELQYLKAENQRLRQDTIHLVRK